MSQENVEVVKAAFDAWNAGDMDRFREMYDPNVVLHTVPDWPGAGTIYRSRGRDAVLQATSRNLGLRCDRTEHGLHRGRGPRSRKTHLAWARARPGREHRDDDDLHDAPGQSHLPGGLLGSRG